MTIEYDRRKLAREMHDRVPILCGIATTQQEREQRLSLVTNRYVGAKYLDENDVRIRAGMFEDKYESSSIPIVAKIDGEVIGSLRLIPNVAPYYFPIKGEGEITIDPQWQETITSAPFEWSQLAKSRKHASDPRAVFALIRAGMAISREQGYASGVAVIDNNVRSYLNGISMGLDIPQVGASVEYMGSISTPVYLDFKKMIESSAVSGHHHLADFFATGKAEGFDWYQGP